MRKLTYEFVKGYFKEQGCELLEEKYKNNRIKMKYKCSCGNISKITFDNFKRGNRCRKCSGSEKHTLKYIKKYFKDNGCELLEKKYVDNKKLMNYRCICNRISKISFTKFRRGRRCRKCAAENNSGKNNGNYNPSLTDEERFIKRNYPEYIQWRKAVYKKDNYTCQKCKGRGGTLNAHHIEDYSNNKKLRLATSNGVTLCKKHHKEFHKIYGTKISNKQQMNEFMNY